MDQVLGEIEDNGLSVRRGRGCMAQVLGVIEDA